MCVLCDEYGDGGIWYLKPENYARNMYKLRAPGERFQTAVAAPETGEVAGTSFEGLIDALEKGEQDKMIQEELARGRRQERGGIGSGMGSQVVPLQDAERILELCSPIALMSCICRKDVRGIDERSEHEYTCVGMGVGMLKWERWPERYKGGVKFVNVEEGKQWTRKMNERGFVHILMLFGAPFIGGFCMCDYPDCNALRMAVDFGLGSLKSHYVAEVDYDICNGCGVCAQRCQWGALKFEVTSEKANIDQFKCYGCGLCETGCPRKAIKLVERTSLPALAEVW